MESSGGNEVTMSMRDEANHPETTIEIKIKTLDSQTYTLQVDKCLPVPALKERIASVTGVLSEQQRLICRGKVLKDDQLLSAYHVEDGHTLHMVVRQSIPPLSEASPDDAAAEQAMNNGHQGGPSIVVGTLNISEQVGVIPDFSRIVSAVLGSFGIASVGSANGGSDIRGAGSDGISGTPDSGLRNATGQQTDQAASTGQSNHHRGASSVTSVSLENGQPPVIPDSLTTLSQYLTRLRDEFSSIDYTVRGRSYDIGTLGAGQQSDSARPRLLSPEALAEVMVSARQILVNQAADCLSRLTQQLEDHVNVTDSTSRSHIQRNVERSGVLLQNLGAALLELGRTATTLRMGPRPVDADVSSNPAVFISTSAPNPVMFQSHPFQHGTSFGVIPVGTPHPGSGLSGGSLGSGFLPRNIDIRIRTGPRNSSPTRNQRDPAVGPQPPVENNPPPSGDGSSTLPNGTGVPVNSSSGRESEGRMGPFRTVVAALPASVRRPSAVINSSRGPVGLFYPVLTRVQRVGSGNLSNPSDNQASNETVEHWNGQFPDFASGENVQGVGTPGQAASTPVDGTQMGEGFQSGLNQLLRSIFPGEQIHVNDINIQRVGSRSGVAYAEPAWGTTFAEPPTRANTQETTQGNVSAQEATPRAGEEGLFLSNLLQQIMPIISENLASGSTNASQEAAGDRAAEPSTTTQDQENSNRETASRQRDDSESASSSKRQKRE